MAPARAALAIAAVSTPPRSAASEIVRAAVVGITPAMAAPRASALSNSSIAAATLSSEKIAASASVVARQSSRQELMVSGRASHRSKKTVSSLPCRRMTNSQRPGSLGDGFARSVDRRSAETRVEDRIGRQRGIAREIDAGVDLAQQAPRQEADIEVRRLFDAVRPDDAGLDRLEQARAVRSGRQAAEAAENTARRARARAGARNRSWGSVDRDTALRHPPDRSRSPHPEPARRRRPGHGPSTGCARLACQELRYARDSRWRSGRSERTVRRSATRSRSGAGRSLMRAVRTGSTRGRAGRCRSGSRAPIPARSDRDRSARSAAAARVRRESN